MLRLVLDNTAINMLAGQARLSRHDRDRLALGLKQRVAASEWHVVGSVSLLEEMLGIGNETRYKGALSLYWDLVRGQLLRPWHERLRDELRLQRALSWEEMLLDKRRLHHVHGKLAGREGVGSTLQDVQEAKREYERSMGEIKAGILGNQRWHQSGKINSTQEWFALFWDVLLQLCVERCSNERKAEGEDPLGPIAPQVFDTLPVTRSWVWFMLAKLYEQVCLN